MISEETRYMLESLLHRVRHVRRWLVSLAMLKAAAMVLLFVIGYVGVYSFIDHRVHLNATGRLVACVLLVLSGVLFLIWMIRLLIQTISCRQAAGHIESKIPLNQQLVTAVEYYECRQHYPYSENLLQYLIRQVSRDSQAVDYNTSVAKWHGIVYGLVILTGLFVGGGFMVRNMGYVSRYWSRLTQPTAEIAPLPPTRLEVISKDVAAETDEMFTLEAAIHGKVPETGVVVIEREPPSPESIGETPGEDRCTLSPEDNGSGDKRFVSRHTLAQGQYKYYFAADEAVSQTYSIRICTMPQIVEIEARVIPPGKNWLDIQPHRVDKNTLDVLPDSQVWLNVKASDVLEKAVIVGVDGKTTTKEVQGKDSFSYSFTASQEGFIRMSLTSRTGAANDKLPDLQIRYIPDAAPVFKLTSPEGDYLATNVASVPIRFEITDDFGLRSAELHLEIAEREPLIIPAEMSPQGKSVTLATTVELEEYDLKIGDSILFYATAEDVDTGLSRGRSASTSDIYFIEVRPYRQLWHPARPSLPGGSEKQGLESSKPLEKLITLLEYTRAIVKKTWRLAQKPELEATDRKRVDSIRDDVGYTSDQLQRIRQAGEDRLPESQKQLFADIKNEYESASDYLKAYDAHRAITPEKNAYQKLRQLVMELEKAERPPGTTPPPEQRDRVVLEDFVHLRRYEKERVEWELQQLNHKLEEIQHKQQQLAKRFEHFLEETQKSQQRQAASEEQTWTDPASKDVAPSQPGNNLPGEQPMTSNTSTEGATLAPPPPSGAQATGNNGSASSPNPSGSQAGVREQTAMLKAHQESLRRDIENLKGKLNQLPPLDNAKGSGDDSRNRELVQGHLDQAIGHMDAFQKQIADSYFQSGQQRSDTLNEAVGQLEQVDEELALAHETMDMLVNLDEKQRLAKDAQQIAKKLSQMAETYDKSASEQEKLEMQEALQAAEQLLKQIPPDYWITQEIQGQGPPSGGPSGTGLGSRVMKDVVSDDPLTQAQLLARQFWTISIQASKRQGELMEDPPSHPAYYQGVNAFYEAAAHYESKENRR